MKNEVKVNGVTLTRDQVEKALKELNEPVKNDLKAGTIIAGVISTRSQYIVIGTYQSEMARAALSAMCKTVENTYLLLDLYTFTLSYGSAKRLEDPIEWKIIGHVDDLLKTK
jgi:hypothetical protein